MGSCAAFSDGPGSSALSRPGLGRVQGEIEPLDGVALSTARVEPEGPGFLRAARRLRFDPELESLDEDILRLTA